MPGDFIPAGPYVPPGSGGGEGGGVTVHDLISTIKSHTTYDAYYDWDDESWPARPAGWARVNWIGPIDPTPPEWVGYDTLEEREEAAPGPSLPDPPTSVAATAGDTTVALTWVAPASDGGSAITGYVVVVYDHDGVPIGSPVFTGDTDLSYTVTGLTNGTAVACTVAAINAVGTGAQSTPSNEVTPTAAATVPGAPTGVSGVSGDTQVVVSWSAPASDGGSSITGYTVTPYIGASAQTPVTVGNVLTATVTGLTNGTAYTFTVAATNAIGTGSASTASSAVTPSAPAVAPTKVQASPWAEGGSGTLSTTCTLPAAPTVGNTLIMVQYSWKSAAEMPVPAGWTVDEVSSSSTRTIRVLRRTVQAGDPTTWTTTTTVGIHQGCIVMEWTPCVLDSHSTATILTGTGATVLGPTAVPSAPAVVVLGIVTAAANVAWNTSSPTYTEADGARALAAHSGAVTTAQSVSVTPAASAAGTAALAVYRGA